MKFYLENLFDQSKKRFEKETANTKLDDKLEALFTPRPFADRWRAANLAMVVLTYICNILSGITAFAMILFLTCSSLGAALGSWLSFVVGSVIAALVVVIVESLKRHSLNNFLRDILQFGKFSILLFVGVLVLGAASVSLSFYGTNRLPTEINNLTVQTEFDSSAVSSNYEAQIANLEKEKQEYFENNKKNNAFGGYRLSSALMPTYNQMITNINELKKEKRIALAQAKQEHNESLTKSKKDATRMGSILGYWALGVELVFILSMLFVWGYYWNCYKERFSLADDTDQNENRLPEGILVTNEKRIVNDSNLRNCEHCKKEYVYKHHKQKYCSDTCRQKAWKKRLEKGVVNGSV